MKRYRVLISGGLASGGPETHLKILCQVLRAEGMEVTIAAAGTNWSRSSIRLVKQLGVRVIVSPFGYGRFAIIGKVLSFISWPLLFGRIFDVVCCIGDGRMHSFACRFVKSNGVTIYHEIVECPRPDSNAFRQASKMDFLVGNSVQVARDMQAAFPGVPVKKIPFLTTNSIDLLPIQNQRTLAEANRPLKVAFLQFFASKEKE